jgi:hypothetical protein
MKLRRAMSVAAASAVLAPIALLTATAAHANGAVLSVPATSDPASSTSNGANGSDGSAPEGGEQKETTPGEGEKPGGENPGGSGTEGGESGRETTPGNEGEKPAEGKPGGENTGSGTEGGPEKENPGGEGEPGKENPENPANPENPGKGENPGNGEQPPGEGGPGEGEEEPPFTECVDARAEITFAGLPGKIAAGSGWHEFTLTVENTSETTLSELDYFAAASADKGGEEIFKSKQVRIQAFDPSTGTWEDLSDEEGYAVGWIGWSDELKPGHEVELPMRLEVKAGAPVGAGFTLGASTYADIEGNCGGVAENSYRFEIVAGGTDTGGTEPQEGGKVPLPTEKPETDPGTGTKTSPQLEGTLAATGSSDVLPTIAVIGGITIVAGAGVVFALRRRGGTAAA